MVWFREGQVAAGEQLVAVDGANRHDIKLIRETIESIYFLISSEF
jgi:hypothetical protein